MTEFAQTVKAAIEKYSMLQSGDTVVVALSGGADSVSLLCALQEISEERYEEQGAELAEKRGAEIGNKLEFSLAAVHINHCLRGEESDRDMRFCEELCARLNIPLEVCVINVREHQQKHESLEECARRERYNAYNKVLERYGEHARLATAHNAGDSAETMLINLMRGTGLKGLCGVPPVRGRIIRPLIYSTREMVEDYLRKRSQNWVTDSTNLSDDYTRNKVRHIIIPEMERINPALFRTISREQESLREDSDYLCEAAIRELDNARSGKGWDAAKLAALPSPIKSRAVREILISGGIEPSALRINTAISLLPKRSARFNPCRGKFFTIRKGICFVENMEQHYKKHEK